jgi:pantetheine-phosphate adenylyltransferase
MTNRVFDSDIETLFMMTLPEYQFISSRFIKETAKLGGDVSQLVPELVANNLAEKFKK